MKLLDPDFVERALMPVVIAFGLGVVAADIARDHQMVAALELADRAVDVAERFRLACGEVYEFGHPVSDDLITVAADVREARTPEVPR